MVLFDRFQQKKKRERKEEKNGEEGMWKELFFLKREPGSQSSVVYHCETPMLIGIYEI